MVHKEITKCKMMGGVGILIVICFAAVAAEIVHLEDMSDDHHKRNLRRGLPETMSFRLRRAENDVTLELQENKRLNANVAIYGTVTDKNGKTRIERDTNIKPNDNVRYYQDVEKRAYVKAECVKRAAGPCTRVLTGNLHINGREHQLKPVKDTLNTKELHSLPGTPHKLEPLVIPEQLLDNMKNAEETQNKTNRSMKERDTVAKAMANSQFTTEKLARDKRATPVVHGVELFIIADHSMFNHFAEVHGGSASTIKSLIREYICHFVNGADLRYSSIIEPDFSIYLSIAGFFIATDADNSTWAHYYPQGKLAGGYTLTGLMTWRANEAPSLPKHDHLALITRLDVVTNNLQDASGVSRPGICGSDCTSITEDHGFFLGASILAHEVAHNLGALHDGDNDTCDPMDFFIMTNIVSPPSDNINRWRFSYCSINYFRTLFNGFSAGSDCTLDRALIYDEDEYAQITEKLAGEVYSLDEQCTMLEGTGSLHCAHIPFPVCEGLWCGVPSGMCNRYETADGTPCGTDQVCFERRCRDLDMCLYRPMAGIDIAKEYESVSQSSGSSAALAVDGSLSTVATTSAELYSWWQLVLSSTKSVFAVKIWVKNDIELDGVHSLQIKVDSIRCGYISGQIPLGSCSEVTCSDGPILGTVLDIQQKKTSPSALNLAEVQVYAGCLPPTDVAYARFSPTKRVYGSGNVITYECDGCSNWTAGDLSRTCSTDGTWTGSAPVCTVTASYFPNTTIRYKVATQSSESSNGWHPATLALDGSKDTHSQTSSEDYPWLEVEFCNTLTISSVSVSNGNNCCADHLRNLLPQIGEMTCSSYQGPLDLGSTAHMYCHTLRTGNTLKLNRMDLGAVLSIAEVGVFAVCLPPEEVEHATFTSIYPGDSVYVPQEYLYYTCLPCYEHDPASGALNRICLSESTWSGTPPVCRARLLPIAEANENQALVYKTATQSQSDYYSNYPPTNAIDGSLDTFSYTHLHTTPYWQVEFCVPLTIGRVETWTVIGMSNISITFDGQFFGSYPGAVGEYSSFNITSSTPLTGTVLKMTRFVEGYLTSVNLAEVKAFLY